MVSWKIARSGATPFEWATLRFIVVEFSVPFVSYVMCCYPFEVYVYDICCSSVWSPNFLVTDSTTFKDCLYQLYVLLVNIVLYFCGIVRFLP